MKSNVKIFIFCILVLSSIVISSFSIKLYLINSTTLLNEKINTIRQLIHSNDWEKASSLSTLLSKDWEKSESKWSLFINHHEIDNITIALVKATQYISAKSTGDAYAALSELKEFIDHIPDMEKLSIKNIF